MSLWPNRPEGRLIIYLRAPSSEDRVAGPVERHQLHAAEATGRAEERV